MRIHLIARTFAGFSALVVSGVLLAIPDQEPIDYATVSAPTFGAVVAGIESEMEPGGRWAALPTEQRERVRGLLTTITVNLKKASTVEDLNPSQKVKVFNAQEEVNAILTGREVRDRMECARNKRTGSRLGHEIRCEVVAIDDSRRFHEQDVIRRGGVQPLGAEGVIRPF
jgi:hypothetical protein